MKPRAVLDVGLANTAARDALVAVLTPDNEGGPRGLGIAMRARGNSVEILVQAESPNAAVTTSLAFLRDIALFQEVWLLSHAKPG